jgi:hypothetical protein
MRIFRKFRIAVALATLVSMLFSQTALAWYACPADAQPGERSMNALSSSADHPMPGCEGMDLEQSALCQAHANPASQSLDRPHPPDPAPFVTSGVMVVVKAPAAAVDNVVASDRYLLTRTTAPPIVIRNCCFRI